MTTATKTDLTNKIIDALEEFGLSDINDDTVVFINKADLSDVEVADSEFETFTKAHATAATSFIDFDGDDTKVDRGQIRSWLESLQGVDFN